MRIFKCEEDCESIGIKGCTFIVEEITEEDILPLRCPYSGDKCLWRDR